MVRSGRREERRAPDISRGAKIGLLLALLCRLDPEVGEGRGELRFALIGHRSLACAALTTMTARSQRVELLVA